MGDKRYRRSLNLVNTLALSDGKQLRCRPGTAVKLVWPAAIRNRQWKSPGRYHKRLPNSLLATKPRGKHNTQALRTFDPGSVLAALYAMEAVVRAIAHGAWEATPGSVTAPTRYSAEDAAAGELLEEVRLSRAFKPEERHSHTPLACLHRASCMM
jgi:hypothetical protein